MSRDTHFLVTFRDVANDEVVTLRAGSISDSGLGLAFVVLSDLRFDRESSVIDPRAETLQRRYANVHALHLPVYNVVSVAEVGAEHPGLELSGDRSNLLVLPGRDDGAGR